MAEVEKKEGKTRQGGRLLPLWKVFPNLRGAAILAVVFTHAVVYYQVRTFSWHPDAAKGKAWLGLFFLPTPFWSALHELSSFAVPLFLFLSGHFLALSPHGGKAVWERVKKLLLPYLFWSLVAWGLSWRKGEGWSLLSFLRLLREGDTVAPYWFIVLLLQYYLLAPWLVPLVKKRPVPALWAGVLLNLSISAWNYNSALGWNSAGYPLCYFPSLIFYVVLGIWAGLYPGRLKAVLESFKPAVLGALLAVSAVLLVGETSFLINEMRGTGEFMRSMLFGYSHWKFFSLPFSLLAIFWVLERGRKGWVSKGWLRSAGKNAFTIYLVHVFVLDALGFVYWHSPGFLGGTPLTIVLDFLAGVWVPILLAKVVRSRIPWAGNLLLGD